MGRRKKGRDVSGWLVIDKPAGTGSTDVVTAVRRAFDAKKAGHAGTLDPAATGVLAVALGEATKTVPIVADGLKVYRFTIRWGAETTTDDAEGETLETSADRPDPAAIESALARFRGDILQTPPRVSAVHVDGRRAYDRAREGEAFEIAPRPLHVAELRLLETPDTDTAVLSMTCGKGGYVRAIARDLGRALGCLGHVETLRRLSTGAFSEADAIPLAALDTATDDMLLPIESALADLPEARLAPDAAIRVRNGNPGDVTFTDAAPGDTVWASDAGTAVALGTYLGGQVHPSRVFN